MEISYFVSGYKVILCKKGMPSKKKLVNADDFNLSHIAILMILCKYKTVSKFKINQCFKIDTKKTWHFGKILANLD